jgi:hypothetical protein
MADLTEAQFHFMFYCILRMWSLLIGLLNWQKRRTYGCEPRRGTLGLLDRSSAVGEHARMDSQARHPVDDAPKKEAQGKIRSSVPLSRFSAGTTCGYRHKRHAEGGQERRLH